MGGVVAGIPPAIARPEFDEIVIGRDRGVPDDVKNKSMTVLRGVSDATAAVDWQKGLYLVHIRHSIACEIMVAPHDVCSSDRGDNGQNPARCRLGHVLAGMEHIRTDRRGLPGRDGAGVATFGHHFLLQVGPLASERAYGASYVFQAAVGLCPANRARPIGRRRFAVFLDREDFAACCVDPVEADPGGVLPKSSSDLGNWQFRVISVVQKADRDPRRVDIQPLRDEPEAREKLRSLISLLQRVKRAL